MKSSHLPPSLVSRTLMLALSCAAVCLGVSAPGAEALRNLAGIRSLPRLQASRQLPVKVRGVITQKRDGEVMTVQDTTAGIWVSVRDAKHAAVWHGDTDSYEALHEGDEIEISGFTHEGGYAPIILPAEIRKIGIMPLPPPRPMVPERLFEGTEDCQRLELRGVLQAFQETNAAWVFQLATAPGIVSVELKKELVGDPAGLVDAEVRLTGVVTTLFNTRGEFSAPRLLVGARDSIEVLRPKPPFENVPKVEVGKLLPFRPVPLGPHRVRIQGTVMGLWADHFIYLQNGKNVVRVETNSRVRLKPGDRVEAAGFVSFSRPIGSLNEAVFKTLGTAPLPSPRDISPETILAIDQQAMKKGRNAEPNDSDGHLVRCTGTLISVQTETADSTLRTLAFERIGPSGRPRVFRALLHHDPADPLDDLQIGSGIELTGLVQLDFPPRSLVSRWEDQVPKTLTLLLRSKEDVRVVKPPSWWTVRHLSLVLAGLLLLLFVVVVWNLQLELTVRRKVGLLVKERNALKEAELEISTTIRERNRLAANLHDTLPQTFQGIAMQLDACSLKLHQMGLAPLPTLEEARTMVEYGLDELRRAVWEMRSLSLRGRSFSEALKGVVDQSLGKMAAQITVHTDGPLELLPEFVSGNLLLIIQEGLRNAQHHGKANHISVKVSADSGSGKILVELEDDGVGFDPAAALGPEHGHYGICGMQERVERLNGTLELTSKPGKGAFIRIHLPQTIDGVFPDAPLDKSSN